MTGAIVDHTEARDYRGAQSEVCSEQSTSHVEAVEALELSWPDRSLERHRIFRELYHLLYAQVLHGCCNSACRTPTCATSRRRRSKGPFRPLSSSTARGVAIELVSTPRPSNKLCPYIKLALSDARNDLSHKYVVPSGEKQLARNESSLLSDPSYTRSPELNVLAFEQMNDAIHLRSNESDVRDATLSSSPTRTDIVKLKITTPTRTALGGGDGTSFGKQFFSTQALGLLGSPILPDTSKRSQDPIIGGKQRYDAHDSRGLPGCSGGTNHPGPDQARSEAMSRDLSKGSSDPNRDGAATDPHETKEMNAQGHKEDGLHVGPITPMPNATISLIAHEIRKETALNTPTRYFYVNVRRPDVATVDLGTCYPMACSEKSKLFSYPDRIDDGSEGSIWPKIHKVLSHLTKGSEIISHFYNMEELGRTDCHFTPLHCDCFQNAPSYDDVIAVHQHLTDCLSPIDTLFPSLPRLCGFSRDIVGPNGWNHVLPQAFAIFQSLDFVPPTIFKSLWQVTLSVNAPNRSATSCERTVSTPSSSRIFEGVWQYKESDIAYLSQIVFAALVGYLLPWSFKVSKHFTPAQKLRQSGHTSFPIDSTKSAVAPSTVSQTLFLLDRLNDDMSCRLVRSLCLALAQRSLPFEVSRTSQQADLDPPGTTIFDRVSSALADKHLLLPEDGAKNTQQTRTPLTSLPFYLKTDNDDPHRYLEIIIEWLRCIILRDWRGEEVFQRVSALGGALKLLASIYDRYGGRGVATEVFETRYVSEGLDIIEMPKRWFGLNDPDKYHILDFPFLFRPSTLVTYFRAVNHSSMTKAYKDAMAMGYMATKLNFGADAYDHRKRGFLRLDARLNRLTEPYLLLNIRRDSILTDAFNQLWRRQRQELLRPLKVRLGYEEGEEGSDHGGVQQEFLRLAVAEALDPKYGIFQTDPLYHISWFQPGSLEPLYKFELLGLLVSLAIYNGITLPVTFPIALYKKLLGRETNQLEDIEDGWPDLAKGFRALRDWTDGDVEDVFCRTYTFSVDIFGTATDFDLRSPAESTTATDSSSPDVAMVTNANRNNYIQDYIQHLTSTSISEQYEAFARGIKTIVDPKAFTLFTPVALKTLIEGNPYIDSHKLEKVTKYEDDYTKDHRSIRDFWSIIHGWTSPNLAEVPSPSSTQTWNLPQDQINALEAGQMKVRQILEFVTASDRLPVGGEDRLAFVIQRYGSDDRRLPGSMTCFGRLLLPEYSTREIMKEKLERAIENAKGFGQA